jgi:hypothetical protein
MEKAAIQPANNTHHGIAVVSLSFEKGINDSKTKHEGLPLTLLSKKPGFITSIKTGRGITGTTAQRYCFYD